MTDAFASQLIQNIRNNGQKEEFDINFTEIQHILLEDDRCRKIIESYIEDDDEYDRFL
jgi:hypothetical protein